MSNPSGDQPDEPSNDQNAHDGGCGTTEGTARECDERVDHQLTLRTGLMRRKGAPRG